jgi:DNA-binding winged helix-turn-helix (wHTH) protein/tetratricopeptide (TPR) repeat protein
MSSIYRFGRFRLDPRSRELWDGERLVGIAPKSFDCLVYLIEHRDRAVGRDELIAAVWGSADVSDHSLAQTLLRARQVLGDTGAERTTIRTVPRFGHRWVAPLDVLADEGAAAEPARIAAKPASEAAVSEQAEPVPTAAPPPAGKTPPRRRHAAIVAAALLCIGAAIGYALWRGRVAQPPPAAAVKAPAPADAASELFVVLPVGLAEDTTETTWVRLGAMDYIASLLQRNAKRYVLPSDQVVSVVGTAGRTEAGDANDLGRLRAVTGASWIIVPRAASTPQGWQVTLDAYHGAGMRSYEGAGSAPLPAAREAVIALMADLGLGDAPAPQAPLPADELRQRVDAALLVGDLGQARGLIESAPAAVREEPRFRVRAGNVAARQGRYEDAARAYRPLAIDDASIPQEVRAAAHMGLGVLALYRSDYGAAEAAYDKAIGLLKNGDDVRLLGRAYMGRGAVHAARNEFAAAMADFGQARVDLQRAGDRIDTANLEINVGMAEVNRGRLEQGIAAFDRAIPILTSFGVRDQLVISLHNKTYAQLGLLDLPGALATSQRALEVAEHLTAEPMRRRLAAARTRVLLEAGRLKDAEALIQRFDAHPDDPAQSDTEFAVLRGWLLAERGDYAAVERSGDAIVGRVERSADMTGQALLGEASWLVIDTSLKAGKIEQAERVLERLRKAPPAPEDPGRALNVQLAQAQIAQARKDPAAATAFAAALAAADERGLPEPVITVVTAWLPHLLAAGELERAAAVVGRIAAYADRDFRAACATAALYRALGRSALAADAEAHARRLAGERSIAVAAAP